MAATGVTRVSDALQPALLGEEDFAFLRGLIHSQTGIYLGDGKRALIAGRLAWRLRALGFSSFAEYCRHVRTSGASEHTALFDSLCTHETRFFREPAHFEYLARTLLPRWLGSSSRRGRHLRLWSAGCSTGEEAYSLAITMLRELRARGAAGEVTFEILATDLSTRAIEAAQDGLYPLARADEVPEADRKAFMLRGRGRWEGRMRAGPELRGLVRFERHNLNATPYESMPRFDAVFCRNVLIYFDAPTRARIAGALLARTAQDGALFVGHAESLHAAALPARALIPSVYVPSSAGPR